jgi:hypothetical protein
MLYLAHFKPFFDDRFNKLNLFNEGLYCILTYHQLAFTDYNSDIDAKLTMSWSMVYLSFAHLIFPNSYFVLKDLFTGIKLRWFRSKAQMKQLVKKDFFEDRRRALVKEYDLKLKKEFVNINTLKPEKLTQIVAEENIPPCSSTFNVYTQRQNRHSLKKKMSVTQNKLTREERKQFIFEDFSLDVIQEISNESQFSKDLTNEREETFIKSFSINKKVIGGDNISVNDPGLDAMTSRSNLYSLKKSKKTVRTKQSARHSSSKMSSGFSDPKQSDSEQRVVRIPEKL